MGVITNNPYGTSKMYLPHKPAKLTKSRNNDEYKQQMFNSNLYFGQIKKDGNFLTIEKDSEGNCWAFGRNITKDGCLKEGHEKIPHIINFLNDKLPNGTILLGELYVDNGTSKDVAKLYNCKLEKSLARQEEFGKLKYYIFDILSYSGTDYVEAQTTHLERYQLVSNVIAFHKLLSSDYITFAKAQFNNLEKYIKDNFTNGEEGTILRHKEKVYMPDKRPVDSIIKFKTEEEHDVICMGFIEPTKEYEGDELDTWLYYDSNNNPITKAYYKGWIGSVKYGVYKDDKLIQIGQVSSGLTDKMLEDIKLNPDKYLNKLFTIQAMGLDKDKLRHGRIIRWRDDIPNSDCTWDKIYL